MIFQKKGEGFWDSRRGPLQSRLKKDFSFLSLSKYYSPMYPDKAVYKQLWKKAIDKPPPNTPVRYNSSVLDLLDLKATVMSSSSSPKQGKSSHKKEKGPPPKFSETKTKNRSTGIGGGEDVWGLDTMRGRPKRGGTIRGTKKGPFLLDVAHDSLSVLMSEGFSDSSTFSLKKYLFYDRVATSDGKVVGWWYIFDRLCGLTGLVFTEEILKRVRDQTETMKVHPTEPFSLHDMVSMEGRVKHMNTVYAAVGTFFQHKGMAQVFVFFFFSFSF